jgi:hypothetical protein
MDDFINEKKEREFLATWITWWNDRRGFIFRAFAPKAAPQMNQAEVIHAGWAHRDLPNLSLLDACQADVRDAVTLDVEIAAYERGTASGGTGPSNSQRQRKKHTEQLKRAKKLGKDMFPKSKVEDGLKMDPNSKHRPQKKKQNKGQRTNVIAENPTAPGIALTCPSGVSFQPAIAQNQYNLTPSSEFCSSYLQIFPAAGQNTITGVSAAPALGTNRCSVPYMEPVNLSQMFRANVPGASLSHATNQTLMPSTNTGVQSFSNVCSVPSVVPINLSQLFPANVPGTSLSSTTNQTQIPNVNTGIQSHLWHSGMSPHPYELVPLPSRAQKCYGCGNIFTDEYRSPPYNLVVKHVDRRVIRRDDRTQQLVYGLDFCNTYYHPQITHIKRKNPIFSGSVHISSDLFEALDHMTKQVVNTYGLKVTITPSR